MESLVDKGLVKSIGVSNFNAQLLWDMMSYCKIKPVVNEIELHPYNMQDKMIKFLKQQHIEPIAYAPLARGDDNSRIPNVLENETIVRLAKKYSKSAG